MCVLAAGGYAAVFLAHGDVATAAWSAGIMLAYGGYSYYTTQENVAKIGPLEINKQEKHPVPIGPIVGGVCIVGGILLLMTGRARV